MNNSKRHTRLRREYLFKKTQEIQQKKTNERKGLLKRAIEQGKQIPTELRGSQEKKLRIDIQNDDAYTGSGASGHVDDEYALAGVEDPKICVTTSRDPSSRLKRFAKEVRLLFPNSQRVNRGNTKVGELVDACRKASFTDIVMLHETRGEPDRLTICHLPYGPTVHFALSNCVMRLDVLGSGDNNKDSKNYKNDSKKRKKKDDNDEDDDDISSEKKTVSEAYPHLIFHEFSTELGIRISNVLKFLFPVPKPDSKRILTFYNENDFISFRHHVYTWENNSSKEEIIEADTSYKSKKSLSKEDEEHGESKTSLSSSDRRKVVLEEVGPRFEMRPYEIKLGILGNKDAETEWALRSYTNSSKKNVL